MKILGNGTIELEFLSETNRNSIDHPKCEHNIQGRWVFRYRGKLYGFSPMTQLQKDIWLTSDGYSDMTEEQAAKFKEKRLSMLRWYCFPCGTVQKP